MLEKFCQLDILVWELGVFSGGLFSEIDGLGGHEIFGRNGDGVNF